MNVYCIVFGIVFTIIGIVFFLGRGTAFIKGLQEMSEEEKRKIHLKKLTRPAACVFLSAGLILVVAGLHQSFLQSAFKWFMIVWFILTGLTAHLISKKWYSYLQR